MKQSAIPAKMPIVWAASAPGGEVNTIPSTSQIGIVNGAASWPTGFPPLCFVDTTAGGYAPLGADFNGFNQIVSAWLQWVQAGGSVQYDSTFCTGIGGYPIGAVLLSTATSGLFWFNTVDQNTTNPDSSGTGWLPCGPNQIAALNAFVTSTKTINTVSGAVSITSSSYRNKYVATAAATFNLALSSTLYSGFGFWADALHGAITLAPNTSDSIDSAASAASVTIPYGCAAYVYTNATGQWYIEWDFSPIELVRYGADPTGTVSSSAAITAWLAAGISSQRPCHMTAGTYLDIPRTIDVGAVAANGFQILGEGQATTTISTVGNGGWSFICSQNGGNQAYLTLSDFGLVGTNTSHAVLKIASDNFSDAFNNPLFRNLRVVNTQPVLSTVTINLSSPGVVNWNYHGFTAGQSFYFKTTGALPTGSPSGVTAGTTYYVLSSGLTTNSFQFAASPGGTAISTSGTQSGVHTAYATGFAAVTMTIASPCVVSWTSHGFSAGQQVCFGTTGALPTPLQAGTPYFVLSSGLGANSFQIAASPGGTATNTTGTQSGAHAGIGGFMPAGVHFNEVYSADCQNIVFEAGAGTWNSATGTAAIRMTQASMNRINGSLATAGICVHLTYNGQATTGYNFGNLFEACDYENAWCDVQISSQSSSFNSFKASQWGWSGNTFNCTAGKSNVIDNPNFASAASPTFNGSNYVGINIVNRPTVIVAPSAPASGITIVNATGYNVNVMLNTSGSFTSNIVSQAPIYPITFTIASPGVVNWTSHGLSAGNLVVFSTAGSLPTGLTAGVPYYVLSPGLSANSFEVSATNGGAAINFTGVATGNQYAVTPISFSNGGAFLTIPLDAGGSITPTYSGTLAWVWYPR